MRQHRQRHARRSRRLGRIRQRPCHVALGRTPRRRRSPRTLQRPPVGGRQRDLRCVADRELRRRGERQALPCLGRGHACRRPHAGASGHGQQPRHSRTPPPLARDPARRGRPPHALHRTACPARQCHSQRNARRSRKALARPHGRTLAMGNEGPARSPSPRQEARPRPPRRFRHHRMGHPRRHPAATGGQPGRRGVGRPLPQHGHPPTGDHPCRQRHRAAARRLSAPSRPLPL